MFKIFHILFLLIAYSFLVLPSYGLMPYPFGERVPLEWGVADQVIVFVAFTMSIWALIRKKYSTLLGIFFIFLSILPFVVATFLFIGGVISGYYQLNYLFQKYL